MYIAQLTNGVVTSVTQTLGIKTDDNHIEVKELDATLLGCTYMNGKFIPPAPTSDAVDPTLWLIDVQPFVERFGAAEFEIAKGETPSAQMFNASIARSQWVNLKSESVQGHLNALVAAGYITSNDAYRILNTPVEALENLALRTTYFKGIV